MNDDWESGDLDIALESLNTKVESPEFVETGENGGLGGTQEKHKDQT